MRSVLIVICILAFPAAGYGQKDTNLPPPDRGETGQALEPEVTIIDRGEELVEEYRINGHLYMIKVTPKKGIPYYLVDSDGDGSFDIRQNELDEHLLIPQWTLFRW